MQLEAEFSCLGSPNELVYDRVVFSVQNSEMLHQRCKGVFRTKTVVVPLIEIEIVLTSTNVGKILNLFVKYVEFKIDVGASE